MNDDNFIKVHPVLFKKYKIKKKIGQGAFGAVYLGILLKIIKK
jgi:serine/threonine protein kinase